MVRIDKPGVTRGNILSRFRCRMSIALCNGWYGGGYQDTSYLYCKMECKYADDRVAYTNGKQNMINKILGKWKRSFLYNSNIGNSKKEGWEKNTSV